MASIIKSAGYLKITLTQNNDYIAIRTNDYKTDPFCYNISGVFGGAKVGLFRNFTKIDGTIGDCEAPMTDGNGIPIEYTSTLSPSISAIMPSNWYILRLANASGTAAIDITINGINFPSDNIITNLTVESL
jgi:hypothetical protein